MMSAVLVVTQDKKQLAKATIDADVFVVGRAPDCNLRVDEPLASRQHFEIVRDRGRYLVQDRGSRNGTTLNGEKLTAKRELKDGDELGIGGTRLKFVCDAGPEAGEEPEEDATRAASPEDFAKKRPGQQVQQKKEKGALEYKLRVLEGPSQGAVFRDWDGPLTLGRALDNHVVLMDDDLISGHHAHIVQAGEEFYIEDLGSSNGTFLNGIKVQRERLAAGGKIKIGKAILAFDLVDTRAQRRKLKIALISVAAIAVIALLVNFLRPEDVAGKHIAAANALARSGNFNKAAEEFQLALKIEPNRVEAKQGLVDMKAELEAQDLLAAAETAGRAEQYDKAKELIYRVLRDRPKNSRALEMEAVIKSIENAEVAMRARNWPDAVRLLDKARETYPKSELIGLRLVQAQKELTAQQSLAKAADALAHGQLDMAEGYLTNVPPASFYYTAAREQMDKIARERKTSEGSGKALSLYREGRLTEALTELEAALAVAPDNTRLVDLRGRVRKMEGLGGPLKLAEDLSQQTTDNVADLLRARAACTEVLNLEPDTLNALRRRAQDARDRLAQQLKALSQSQTTTAEGLLKSAGQLAGVKAEELLKPQTLERARQFKKAWELMSFAAKADENNQVAVQGVATVQKQIVGACQELYRRGLGLEELGSDAERKAAQECYRAIVEIGIPDEKYFNQATAKLR
jgi:pSer/pThr/pTyr-binding forkhead associated (FHA) protein